MINLIMNQTYETINDCWKKIIDSISLNNSYLDSSDSKLIVRSFHLSLLTDQEESEIHSKGKKKGKEEGKYQNFVEFRNKTAISENEQNFALSLCSRKTYYIKNVNIIQVQRKVLFDIDELDPWQEMIMKNYLELKRTKEKMSRKRTFDYLHSVTDTDSDLEIMEII